MMTELQQVLKTVVWIGEALGMALDENYDNPSLLALKRTMLEQVTVLAEMLEEELGVKR